MTVLTPKQPDSAPIYLDHNATTPIADEVADAMEPFLRQGWGNPSSSHLEGRRAQAALVTARDQVASLIGAGADEIVFTSGGSESNNLALKGIIDRFSLEQNLARLEALDDGASFPEPAVLPNVVTTRIEHPAVLEPLLYLERTGRASLTIVEVERDGRVSEAAIKDALNEQTVMLSVMHSNNETGALQPVREIALLAKRSNAIVHTDAAQSAGKVKLDVQALGVDLLTLVGHKLYGPKGVGALYIRDGVRLESQVHGAGQENGRRAGTENVLLAVGLGAACALAERDLVAVGETLLELRNQLHALLNHTLGDRLVVNGPELERLPNTLNICIAGVEGAAVLAAAPEIAASTGSACHEGEVTLSPVLSAMGVDPELGRGALRLTLGRTTTLGEIETAAAAIVRAVEMLT